jgi:hypothetical protein
VPVITVVKPPTEEPKKEVNIKVELEEKKPIISDKNGLKKEVVRINVEPSVSK